MLARPLTAAELADYLERIGIPERPDADREGLAGIVEAHARWIPFEDLDALCGRTPGIDTDALVAKLVRGRRGGWCFEQNLLLAAALEALGFAVRGLAARVVHGRPATAGPAPRSHMLLEVDLAEGPALVDVGFGGMTLTGVLARDERGVQPTPHEPFQLVDADQGIAVRARLGQRWDTLYTFDLCPQQWADYEVTNWYLSQRPGSHFRDNLMAARAEPGRRFALSNGRLSIHHLDGPTEQRRLDTPREVRETLATVFLLDPPASPELDAALARVL